MSEVTRLINAVGRGRTEAASELLPLIYEELRSLARARMAHERSDHTLQATALVHEAYLRLVGDGNLSWDSRGHFFAAAAEAMRRILVEHARHRQALKCGGKHLAVPLSDDFPQMSAPFNNPEDLLALDEALAHLERKDVHRAQLVKLLYFAGLNLDDAAAALGLSRTTAYRQWTFARAWLFDAISGKKDGMSQEQENANPARDGKGG